MIKYYPGQNQWVSEYSDKTESRCRCIPCDAAWASHAGTNWEKFFGEPELKTNAALDLLREQIEYNSERIDFINKDIDHLFVLIEETRTERAVLVTKNNELETALAKLTKEL